MNLTKEQIKPLITLFKAHNSLTKYIKKDISKTGFDLNEFAVLEVIYHHGALNVQKINEKILVAPSSLSYILTKLQNKNLINRETPKEDRRATIVSLSNEGKKIAYKIFPKHYENIINLFSTLTNEEQILLSELLKKLGTSVENDLK